MIGAATLIRLHSSGTAQLRDLRGSVRGEEVSVLAPLDPIWYSRAREKQEEAHADG